MIKIIKDYWTNFCKNHNLAPNTAVDAFAFGATDKEADELASLVNNGIKTATTSAYVGEQEPLPQVGEYNIILNSQSKPICVIQTTSVEVMPYNKISARHAFLEGEGDRSYQYWKKVHDSFFEQEFIRLGKKFTSDSLMVCEIFKKVP